MFLFIFLALFLFCFIFVFILFLFLFLYLQRRSLLIPDFEFYGLLEYLSEKNIDEFSTKSDSNEDGFRENKMTKEMNENNVICRKPYTERIATKIKNENQDNNNLKSDNKKVKKHKKVFLFIVDALRLDFMIEKKYVEKEKVNLERENDESPYNKFVNMHSLLRNNATQTAIFGFRADPPTVTSQRLKGNNLQFYVILFVILLFTYEYFDF
jgi:hypothetical protein